MLFAVLIGPAGDRAATEWSAEERREFLEALKSTRRLALEAAYGDDGSLLVLEAESMHDALALLHNDPYVIACGRVQVRPLVVNYVGRLEPEAAGRDRAERERAHGAAKARGRFRTGSPVTVLRRRKQNGSG